METDFFKRLIELYNTIQFPKKFLDICKLDSKISWYLADQSKSTIYVDGFDKTILELDISSAYPNICRNIFGEESDFVKTIYSIESKLERNIFISKSLKDTRHLRRFNYICKMIILIIVFEILKNEDFDILELKKDGIILDLDYNQYAIITNILSSDNYNNNILNYILKECNFVIHLNKYNKYIRISRTSFFIDENNQMIIKGRFKHIPKILKNEINSILIDHNNYDKNNLNRLKRIFSRKYIKICYLNNLKEIIEDCYLCDNNKFLDEKEKYIEYNRENVLKIEPNIYLQLILFPIIKLNRD